MDIRKFCMMPSAACAASLFLAVLVLQPSGQAYARNGLRTGLYANAGNRTDSSDAKDNEDKSSDHRSSRSDRADRSKVSDTVGQRNVDAPTQRTDVYRNNTERNTRDNQLPNDRQNQTPYGHREKRQPGVNQPAYNSRGTQSDTLHRDPNQGRQPGSYTRDNQADTQRTPTQGDHQSRPDTTPNRQPAPGIGNWYSHKDPQANIQQGHRDFSNLGSIFRRRAEHHDTHVPYTPSGDRDRDRDKNHDRRDYRHHFPHFYDHYRFDYFPGRCYPTIYSFYYGYFPPYIDSGSIVIIDGHSPMIVAYGDVSLPLVYSSRYSGGGDYYLTRRNSYSGLADALDDIADSWRTGDMGTLSRHIRRDETIDVYIDNQYTYTIQSDEYSNMTQDAMANLSTDSFDFYRLKRRDNDEVVAFAKHVYFDDHDDTGDYVDGGQFSKTVYVSYTLRKANGYWYITEVGSSTQRYY